MKRDWTIVTHARDMKWKESVLGLVQLRKPVETTINFLSNELTSGMSIVE